MRAGPTVPVAVAGPLLPDLTAYEVAHTVSRLDAIARYEPARARDIYRLLRAETAQQRWSPEAVPRKRRRWRRPKPPVARQVLRERRYNIWYEVKIRAGDLDGYLDDVRVAEGWAARAAEDEEQRAEAIAAELRYAFTRASVNVLAGRAPPGLLAVLVERGLWSIVRALGYARNAPTAGGRARALARLCPYLDVDARADIVGEALEEVATITDDDALLTRRVEAETARSRALAELAPFLGPDQLSVAIAHLDAMRDEVGTRIYADAWTSSWRAVTARLARTGDTERALAIATRLGEPYWWDILEQIAPVLPKASILELMGGGADAALPPDRVASVLAPQLARHGATRDAVDHIARIDYDFWRSCAIADLGQYLRPDAEEWPAVISLARALGGHDNRERASALCGLVATSPEPYREWIVEELFRVARGQADIHGAETLARLVGVAPECYAERLLKATLALDRDRRPPVLARLVERFAELRPAARAALPKRNEFVSDGQLEAIAIVDPELAHRLILGDDAPLGEESIEAAVEKIERVSPFLPDEMLEATLHEVSRPGDSGWFKRKSKEFAAFARLYDVPNPEHCDRIDDWDLRERALARHLPALRAMGDEEMLAFALDYRVPVAIGMELLRTVGPRLGHERRMALLAQARYRSRALRAFADALSEAEVCDVLRMLRAEAPESYEVMPIIPLLPEDALMSLVPFVRGIRDAVGPSYEDIVHETVEALCRVGRHQVAHALLTDLAPVLGDRRVVPALKYIASASPLATVPPIVDEARARGTGDPWLLAELSDVLLIAGTRLDQPALVSEALGLAWESVTQRARGVESVARAIREVTSGERAAAIEALLDERTDFYMSSTRTELIAALTPQLNDAEVRLAVDAAGERGDEDRALQLMQLLPRLSGAEADELLLAVGAASAEVSNDIQRSSLLMQFADALQASDWGSAHAAFRSLLDGLASRRRTSLATNLPALALSVDRLGERHALDEAYKALADVAAWWP